MRPLPLVLLLLAASPAFADPLSITDKDGSPAIESSGSSSTTLSVVGGAVSVTVEGGGSLNVYSNSGTVSGQGSLGVPQLGIDLGGSLGSGGNGTGGNAAQPADGGVPAMVGELRDGIPSTGEGSCVEQLPASRADAAVIARIVDVDAVAIMLSCSDDRDVDAAVLDAVAGNAVLVAALAASGHVPADMLSLQLSGEGRALLYVARAD
jgi:hypothetical protein